MRALAAIVLLLSAGCLGASGERAPSDAVDATPTPASPTTNATVDAAAPVGERAPRRIETFVLTADKTLTTSPTGAGKVPVGNTPRAFLTSDADAAPVDAWASPPFERAFELTGESELTLTLSSDTPAPGGKDAIGVPSNVVAWVGSPGRWAVFVPFPDAPAALEAGKTYTLKARIEEPGLFFRVGETITITPAVLYETPGMMTWSVGDANLSGLRLDHQHFNVSAPASAVVLDESVQYQCAPNAGPLEHAIEPPAGTVYLVVELAATSAVPGRFDLDFRVVSGETVLGAAHGPNAKETIVVGPTLLASADAIKTTMPCPSPQGSYTLKATAYGGGVV